MIVKKILDYIGANSNNINPSVLETVLQNGVIEAVEVANEYTDSQRLGYVATEETVILSEREAMGFGYGCGGFTYDTPIKFEDGATYRVYWDGVPYDCVALADDTGYTVMLGNTDRLLFNNRDNGMPFAMVCEYYFFEDEPENNGGGCEYFWYPDVDSGVTEPVNRMVKITREVEVVHTIDSKFIPPVDALILNGVNGKQYKLIVDNLGSLKTEEV